MSLPGVRTILKDRFYSLSRTDAPESTRVVVLARRNNEVYAGEADTIYTNYESLPAATVETVGDEALVRSEGRIYTVVESTETAGTYSWEADETSSASVEPNFTHYTPRSERDVIAAFGQYSELHRAYVETLAGGASRVILVPLPAGGDIADSLVDAFEAAEVARADIIVPWGNSEGGFHADTPGMAAEVIEQCKTITDRSNPVFAVMGVSSSDGASLNDHITALGLERNNDGQYLSVVVTEVRPTAYSVAEKRAADNGEDVDLGWGNGAPQYAALLANLPSETAGTGKRLRGVEEMRYEPNRTQQRLIIDGGGVPVTRNYSRQPVVVDAQTSAVPSSDYIRLSTLRIVFDAIQLVRRASEPFVGEAATLDHKNALETAITSVLRDMKLAGALLDADSVVTYAPRENKAYIDLVLTPAFEIRNIEVAISVQL